MESIEAEEPRTHMVSHADVTHTAAAALVTVLDGSDENECASKASSVVSSVEVFVYCCGAILFFLLDRGNVEVHCSVLSL